MLWGVHGGDRFDCQQIYRKGEDTSVVHPFCPTEIERSGDLTLSIFVLHYPPRRSSPCTQSTCLPAVEEASNAQDPRLAVSSRSALPTPQSSYAYSTQHLWPLTSQCSRLSVDLRKSEVTLDASIVSRFSRSSGLRSKGQWAAQSDYTVNI